MRELKTLMRLWISLPVLILFIILLPKYNVSGQFNPDTVMQQNIEKYQELGEKGFIKDCMSNEILTKSLCVSILDVVKEKMKDNQNLTSSNASSTGYQTYNDYNGGYSVQYPSDWHLVFDNLVKGTREFSVDIFRDPKYAILDTDNFADIMRDVYREDDGKKITGNFGQINIGGEAGKTFSYLEGYKETMVAALMHNDDGYLFKYQTQKENFDKDTDMMIQFYASVRFLS